MSNYITIGMDLGNRKHTVCAFAILYNAGHHSQILLAARGSAFVKCQDTVGLA